MTGLGLLLVSAAVRCGLVIAFVIAAAGIAGMLWDCTVGPSAQAAKAARRQARGVGA
ncbi:hypothetical protein [Brachybacterium phenoliresistens]|uniref:hypothetical protein n=1 Tax=Brachybacterium phenoliresistens TaxID=396014 RepID=UPI0031E18DA6